jgi:hypothetical protein
MAQKEDIEIVLEVNRALHMAGVPHNIKMRIITTHVRVSNPTLVTAEA